MRSKVVIRRIPQESKWDHDGCLCKKSNVAVRLFQMHIQVERPQRREPNPKYKLKSSKPSLKQGCKVEVMQIRVHAYLHV